MTGRAAAVLRALGALAVLVALVIGVPALLVATVGNPFPASLPSVDEIRILLTQNGQGFTNFVIGVLAVLVWFVWMQLIVALVVEVAATARRRETRRLPMLPGVQQFAGRLVAAITLASSLAMGPLLAPAVGALEWANTPAVQPVATTTSEAAALSPSFPAGNQALAPSVDTRSTAPARLVVSEQIELWDLAEAAYGDGLSWKVIAAANAGQFDAAGVAISDDTDAVAAGTELALPGLDADQVRHLVTAGESMWSIAAAAVEADLGRPANDHEVGQYWTQVVDANTNVASGDVDLIFPGDELVMPELSASADALAVLPGPQSVEADQAEEPPPTGPGASYEVSVWTPHSPLVEEQTAAQGASDAAESADLATADEDLSSAAVDDDAVASPPSLSVDSDSSDVAVMQEDVVQRDDASTAVAADEVAELASDDQFRVIEADVGQAGAAVSDDVVDGDDAQLVPMNPIAEAAANDYLQNADGPAPGTVADTENVAAEATLAADTDSEEESIPVVAVGLASLGMGLVAAGVVGAVRRRRDRQRRTRPAGAKPIAPSTEAAAFEAALHHASDSVTESALGGGWRSLPASVVDEMRADGMLALHAQETGELCAIAVGADPAPLAARAPVIDSDLTAGLTVSAPPAMVVLGTDPATGGAVLLDLVPGTRVGLVGDDRSVRRLARSLVLDVAVSERIDEVFVVAIDVASELGDLERVNCVPTIDDAHALVLRAGLAASDSPPLVVVTPHEISATDQAAAALVDLGAVILAAGTDTAVTIEIDGDSATLLPSQTRVALAALNDDDYRSVCELVETTSADAVEVVDDVVSVDEVLNVVPTQRCSVEPGAIEVRVLGTVEIAGAESFSSLKAVDVISYLAFHRNGADADQIKTWVWPPFDPPTDKALANVMSRARTGLGADDEGNPYLSRAGSDKTYRLSPDISTDFDRFRALIELADRSDTTSESLTLLKQAVELIRGVPFSGGAASSFAWADNHVRAQVEFTIDEAVHRCADLALDLGDLATARWAALKGLELVPGCEQCYRRRFLVAGASNNRSELRRAMADLERSAAAELGEPEAVDLISVDLLDLYNDLDHDLMAGST